MSAPELNPRFTFETFVVGGANRLAVAAARRVAESPGSSYNPLFVYSASGLGKTHLLSSIGNHAGRIHQDTVVTYDSMEHFMERAMRAIEAGERESFRSSFAGTALLLLDDVQFLAGKHRTQEELLRVWDVLTARGGQVVLASDRPPQEIDGLDDRLLSRFSGGLIVDIGAPDLETRVAILRRKAEEHGQKLEPGVEETLARSTFSNVRALQGALNRILAVQELEERKVDAQEAARILGMPPPEASAPSGASEFSDFMAEISSAVGDVLTQSAHERQIADAILRWEGEGYRTRRLEGAMGQEMEDEALEPLIRGFEADVERLREMGNEIRSLDPDAPELSRQELLRDPDRLEEAESLLAQVRERARPLPGAPAELTFADARLSPQLLAVRAAQAVAQTPGGERYNPLYVHGPAEGVRSTLLGALANRTAELHPELPVAYIEGPTFAAELIAALERNMVGAWRDRWCRARVLVLDDVDALAGTERAQEELFHIFDTLARAGAQLAFGGSQPPGTLGSIEERLRSRLGSGLVVAAADREDADAAAQASPTPAPPARGDDWFRDPEKLLWMWPYPEHWLIEELDG
ncbi:MAG TPA: DnaA/Hda family protein [Longimicrobiales bacterium]|nr:DnaA/Hda family protein [Longimicrobiales bacterium]